MAWAASASCPCRHATRPRISPQPQDPAPCRRARRPRPLARAGWTSRAQSPSNPWTIEFRASKAGRAIIGRPGAVLSRTPSVGTAPAMRAGNELVLREAFAEDRRECTHAARLGQTSAAERDDEIGICLAFLRHGPGAPAAFSRRPPIRPSNMNSRETECGQRAPTAVLRTDTAWPRDLSATTSSRCHTRARARIDVETDTQNQSARTVNAVVRTPKPKRSYDRKLRTSGFKPYLRHISPEVLEGHAPLATAVLHPRAVGRRRPSASGCCSQAA